jgi:hypothetical protein
MVVERHPPALSSTGKKMPKELCRSDTEKGAANASEEEEL